MKRRIIFLGLDGMRSDLLKRFIKEGEMPFLKHMIEEGVYSDLLPTFPPITPCSWTSMLTGTWPGTHGVYFSAKLKGDPVDKAHPIYTPEYCQAEMIFQTMEKAGKFPIVLHFPGTWGEKGPIVKKGIQVGGGAVGTYTVGEAGIFEISPPQLFTTCPEEFKGARKIQFKPNGGFFETHLKIAGALFDLRIEKNSFKAKILSRGKEFILPSGQWSDWIREKFETPGRSEVQKDGFIRFKVLPGSKDWTRFHVLSSHVNPARGYTYPEELSEEITNQVGPFLEREQGLGNDKGWVSTEDDWYEICKYQAEWMAKTAQLLTEKYTNWDALFSQFHSIDHLGHLMAGDLAIWDPAYRHFTSPKYTPTKEKKALQVHSKFYALNDKWVKDIAEIMDEDTILIVASDHGMVPCHTKVSLNNLLRKAGLLELKEENGVLKPDLSRTKAIQSVNRHYIDINLKGRDPGGIVPPEDYEKVRSKVIEVLSDLRDPRFSNEPLLQVFRKEEGETMGIYGERAGDIFFISRPGYRYPSHFYPPDGSIFEELQEPDARHPFYHPTLQDVRGVFLAFGKGIRRGIKLKRPVRPVDIAPTIAHLLDIPLPKDNEGRILYEILD